MIGYVLDVLADAQIYAEHANHSSITLPDVRMAIESRVGHSFTTPPNREVRLYRQHPLRYFCLSVDQWVINCNSGSLFLLVPPKNRRKKEFNPITHRSREVWSEVTARETYTDGTEFPDSC